MKVKYAVMLSAVLSILMTIENVSFAGQNRETDTRMNYSQVDSHYLNPSEIQKLLQKSYYHGSKMDIFSSSSIFRNTPELYSASWALDILDKLGIKDQAVKRFQEDTYRKLEFDSRLSEIENVGLFSHVNKELHRETHNEDNYKKINSHYDADEGLFFETSKDEDMRNKIFATSVALDAMIDMNQTKELEEIKKGLLKLYVNDEFFTFSNKEDNIVNNGGIIISMLQKLGFSDASLKREFPNVDRHAWFSYWISELYKGLGTDWGSVDVLKTTIEISSFFDMKVPANTNYLNQLFLGWDGIEGFGVGPDAYAIQPPYVDKVLAICQYFHYAFPYKKQLINYLYDQIESEFTKTDQYIKFSVEDNFYGIALANAYKFDYDRKKMIQTLQENYRVLVEENSSITDSQKLREVYYLILSYHEEKMVLPESKIVEKAVVEYLSNMDQAGTVKSVEDLVLGVKIIQLLGLLVPSDINKLTHKVLEKVQADMTVLDSKQAHSILELISISNEQVKFNDIKNRTLSLLNGYFTDTELEKARISLTFRRASALSKQRPLTEEEQSKIRGLIAGESTKKTFSNSAPTNATTLRTLYEGSLLTTFYTGR
ncbi:hypothetical protein [Tumebacillus flagellatus]|uniref:SLH domain-containing protein n=1 Tax=Tumebacillus flagellatus TaxID=1157490 RepID=A0A074LYY9_9BACL|nr:hypothetical protein [Tumebacillus flagellatus]KEO85278.1 hypothetical protein EL26_01590 [Tumebacillus flagellatus]